MARLPEAPPPPNIRQNDEAPQEDDHRTLSRKTAWLARRRYGEAARLEIAAHPHMLRNACGYNLANDGQDTSAIQHTVHYTDLSAHRFKEFWKD